MFLKTNLQYKARFLHVDKRRNLVFNSMLSCFDFSNRINCIPFAFPSELDEYRLYRFLYKEKYACAMRPIIHVSDDYTWEQVVQYMNETLVSLRPTFVKHSEEEATLILRSYSCGKLGEETKVTFICNLDFADVEISDLGKGCFFANSLDGVGLNHVVAVGKQCLHLDENAECLYERTLDSVAERVRWINKEDIFDDPLFESN